MIGMIAAIQTHGELLHWHPHIHVLITCGAWTPEGDFLELPEFDMERLLLAWQEAVFQLYLAEEKVEPEVVENMRTWQHSGFSVNQSVFLPGDLSGVPSQGRQGSPREAKKQKNPSVSGVVMDPDGSGSLVKYTPEDSNL